MVLEYELRSPLVVTIPLSNVISHNLKAAEKFNAEVVFSGYFRLDHLILSNTEP